MKRIREKLAKQSSVENYDGIVYTLCYILFSVVILALLLFPFVDLSINATEEKVGSSNISNNSALPTMATRTSILPLDGDITSKYGWRSDPIYTSQGKYGFHNGIDISASKSDKICAYRDGTVKVTGYSDSYGYYMIISHSDHESFYAHCAKILVASGDEVLCGENIAIAGDTGRATGKHLHFEIRVNDSAVDPMEYIK